MNTREDLIKRFESTDGMTRIDIVYDTFADNPMVMTDEPLHIMDWCREYSLMTTGERKNAESLCKSLLYKYGDANKVIAILSCETNTRPTHDINEQCLVYDAKKDETTLRCWCKCYGMEKCAWVTDESFKGKPQDIDFDSLVGLLTDETIRDLFDGNVLDDNIRWLVYSFDGCGHVTFRVGNPFDSDGVIYLDKKEFLDYSGCEESYWDEHGMRYIERSLIEEFEAWTRGEVYAYIVEVRHDYEVTRKCVNRNDVPETKTKETEWEQTDSCFCFYGDINYCISAAKECVSDDVEFVEVYAS